MLSCNNHKEYFQFVKHRLVEYNRLNDLLLDNFKNRTLRDDFTSGYDIITSYDKDSLLVDKQLSIRSKNLINDDLLQGLIIHRPALYQYRIKQEKKEPYLGLGLRYFTYSLFYSKLDKDEEKEIIKETIKGAE